MNLKKNKIGILGGTFDPAHKGHLTISKEAVKRFMLKEVIWAITKKNPFKRKSNTNLTTRIKNCKKIDDFCEKVSKTDDFLAIFGVQVS